jgi:hypothetical protein
MHSMSKFLSYLWGALYQNFQQNIPTVTFLLNMKQDRKARHMLAFLPVSKAHTNNYLLCNVFVHAWYLWTCMCYLCLYVHVLYMCLCNIYICRFKSSLRAYVILFVSTQKDHDIWHCKSRSWLGQTQKYGAIKPVNEIPSDNWISNDIEW